MARKGKKKASNLKANPPAIKIFSPPPQLLVFDILSKHPHCSIPHHVVWMTQDFHSILANSYLFKVNSRNTRKKYKICSKLTMFLLVTLNK